MCSSYLGFRSSIHQGTSCSFQPDSRDYHPTQLCISEWSKRLEPQWPNHSPFLYSHLAVPACEASMVGSAKGVTTSRRMHDIPHRRLQACCAKLKQFAMVSPAPSFLICRPRRVQCSIIGLGCRDAEHRADRPRR